MRVALVHVSKEAWVTGVETLTPVPKTFNLVGSAEEARQRLREEGYVEAWGFRGEVGQVLVFVHEPQMALVEPPVLAELAALKIKSEALEAETKSLKAELQSEHSHRLERLLQAHNILCEDRHQIEDCRCSLATTWRATKNRYCHW